MKDNAEQREEKGIFHEANDSPTLRSLELFKFDQLENENLAKISGDELTQNRITNFTDSKNRPITIKEWPSGKFIWMRAYDINRTQVPDNTNSGQAGLLNLMVETDHPDKKKLRLGDINIPKAYRGSGIAKKMLDQSIFVAKEQGASQIYGVIENQDARNFWEHLQEDGWQIDSEKGAYGYVFFDIPDDSLPNATNVSATAQGSDFVEASSKISRLEKPAHETRIALDKFPVEQVSETHADAPILTDNIKKVLVGISILTTLTSSGLVIENYKKNHPDAPEGLNEFVVEKPGQNSVPGNLIENNNIEYHLTDTPSEKVKTTIISEQIATPAAEIIDQKLGDEDQLLNEKPENATYWYEVPEYKQPDAISCTPTSVSMVMGYWNKIDSKYPSRSAKELYKENVEEGKFSPAGMAITDLDDEIQALNYESKTVANGTRADLGDALAKGPVIALVKYSGKELSPRGVNHSVVVSGITEDDQVRVTDPLLGNSRLYTWSQFDSAWSANWGTGATRYFTSIHPSDKADE